jgi:hypothetical protein
MRKSLRLEIAQPRNRRSLALRMRLLSLEHAPTILAGCRPVRT